MSKKKISILTNWYLPGTKAGGPIRSLYSLIASLKDEFDVYLISTLYDLDSEEPYQNIKANEWFTKENVNYFYFSKSELNKKNLLHVLNDLNSDLIYINSFWSYLFSIYIVQLKNKGIIQCPLILAPRGMLGKGALTIKPFKKHIYIALSKLKGFYEQVIFHATNLQEEIDIKTIYPQARVSIVENMNSAQPLKIKKAKKENHLKLFYLSRISPVKNLLAALELLKKVSAKYQIEYNIYGNIEDASYWNKCLLLIEKMPNHIVVSYKGELPFYSIQQNIAGYHYLFLPTLNENYGHSIVESLMSSCPVIISDQTPWNDIEKEHAGYALPLNDPTKFILTIEHCAALDINAYEKASEDALNYICKKINLPLIKEKYIKLFNDAK